jgi:hypothetical protein
MKALLLSSSHVIYFGLLVSSGLVSANESNDSKSTSASESFRLENHISGLTVENAMQNFPFDSYAAQDHYQIGNLLNDIKMLSDTLHDQNEASRILFTALTEHKQKLAFEDDSTFDFQALNKLLHWAYRCQIYAQVDTVNQQLLSAISDHWVSFVCNALRKSYAKDDFLKYTFEFRYIDNFCQELGYNPGIGSDTNIEKVLGNAVNGKWSYLANRFWTASDWKFKTICFLGLLLTLYAYFFLLKTKIKLMRK